MLSDRNYMRNQGPRHSPVDGLMMVFMLIAANVVIALLFGFHNNFLDKYFVLTTLGVKRLWLWQFVTYMFLHGGTMHLLFNMYGLFLFGKVVAPALGANRFMTLYFGSGIVAAMIWLLFNFNTNSGIIGASGALFGVMIAAAMYAPDLQFILIIPPMPIKLKTLVLVYGLLEIIFVRGGGGGNIAHLAHLGGIVGGYLFMKLLFSDQVTWDPLGFLGISRSAQAFKPKVPKGWKMQGGGNKTHGVSQQDLDHILDKISAHGINSLSEEEMQVLKSARKEMKKNK
jgi:membrane associated rhomboid family serine protease